MEKQTVTKTQDTIYLSDTTRFEVKLSDDPSELKQARKLRLAGHSKVKLTSSGKICPEHHLVHSNNNDANKITEASLTRKLIEQHKLLIHDGYDSYAQHLIVTDLRTLKIIAYVRIIDAFTAFKIGGFYSETQFNLSEIFNKQQYLMEISRLAIHPDYNNGHIARLLWSGLSQHAIENGVDAIIGSLSIALNDDYTKINQLILQFKAKQKNKNKVIVNPYQLLPDNKAIFRLNLGSHCHNDFCSEETYLDYFFSKGFNLCGDAHWNKSLNTAELFVYYNVTNTQHIPHCIHMNEVELGILCD